MKKQVGDRLPLEDIRIIDFGWVIACPHGTRLLADLGAQVIRIESRTKIDGLRGDFPREGSVDPLEEGGAVFQEQNRNKLGISLNMKSPKGREILGRLVKISDAVTANFDPLGFQKLGLGWENLKQYNPGIVIVNAPGLGNTGPYSTFMSFGPILQALSGFTNLIGYPGQEPVGTAVPLIDYLGGAALAIAVLAAIEFTRQTGKGQYIDISQHEVALSLIGPSLLDWQVNHTVRPNCGNHQREDRAAPHSCYRCRGEERYCVVSVSSDVEWRNFCRVMGNPNWAKSEKFATHLGRILNQDELDRNISAWTMGQDAESIVSALQQAGVSSSIVQNSEDLIKHDIHLRKRGFLAEVRLPDTPSKNPEKMILPGVISHFSGQNLTIRHGAPGPVGQDNNFVYKNILGMSQSEIDEAAAEGAFY